MLDDPKKKRGAQFTISNEKNIQKNNEKTRENIKRKLLDSKDTYTNNRSPPSPDRKKRIIRETNYEDKNNRKVDQSVSFVKRSTAPPPINASSSSSPPPPRLSLSRREPAKNKLEIRETINDNEFDSERDEPMELAVEDSDRPMEGVQEEIEKEQRACNEIVIEGNERGHIGEKITTVEHLKRENDKVNEKENQAEEKEDFEHMDIETDNNLTIIEDTKGNKIMDKTDNETEIGNKSTPVIKSER